MATTIGSTPSVASHLDAPREPVARDVIAALRDRAEAIRREELQRLDGRWDGLRPDDRLRLELLTRAIVEALLREPTPRLRAGALDAADLDSARFLFALDRVEDAAA
jgi:glutamyl-tRNA reductase